MRDSIFELEEDMEPITNHIDEFLKQFGFTRHNRTFNRWTKDGLCDVFNLQMGIKSLTGQFTANLGVFVPEIYRGMMNKEPPSFILEPDCALRARFCNFTDTDDEWWEITPYPDSTISELVDLLQTYGLPFFLKFPDRKAIINQMIPFDDKYCVSMLPKLEIAFVLEHLGQHEEAESMFKQHYLASVDNEIHIAYLKKVALRHNWSISKHK